jgi:transposase
VIAELRAVNAEQARLIDTLQARVVELERRLGKDSSSSSKPPSSDGLGKPARAGRQDDERAARRRPGKQPGAPGAHLAQVAQPDEVALHAPDRCGGCGADLAGASVVGFAARQVFDLPPLRLLATEHRAERRRCACGTTTQAAFPDHVRAAACYGPGVRARWCATCACTSTCRWTGPRSYWPICSAHRWPLAPWPP